ncbi:MAG: MHS family MFS transporter [Alphaproteobacteria bacterium]|nr:MHS family MFS transporter [Alphaproteobacteria bacterium]
MSATGTPPSNTIDKDVRNLHAKGKHTVDPSDIAVGVIIGRTSEFFDFFVYAIASVLVFPKLVFSFVDPYLATVYSFIVFALAFVVRPLGTLIFMEIDVRYGRSAKMTAGLFLLGTSTVALTLLPSYEEFGVFSIIVLVVCRLGQGIAWGGTWDGLASLLALSVKPARRGWYAMLPQLGAPLGLLVATALFAYLLNVLSAEDFTRWGWRYTFIVAFAINVVALFARLRTIMTEEYKQLFEKKKLAPTAVIPTIRKEGRNILLGAFAPLASFALFHMVTVFPLSWVFLFTEQDIGRFLVIEMIGAAVCTACVVGSGYLADRIGRRSLLLFTAGAIAAFSGFAPQLLDGGEVGETVFMMLGFVLLGLSFGQSSGSIANKFSPSHRYTASALTSDLAWLFGAGFAPLAALLLSSHWGLMASGAYLLSGALCTLGALALADAKQHSAKD